MEMGFSENAYSLFFETNFPRISNFFPRIAEEEISLKTPEKLSKFEYWEHLKVCKVFHGKSQNGKGILLDYLSLVS